MIKPHDYQQKCVDEIIEKFKDKKSVVLQSDTGSGKTVMFSFLAKYWAENKKSKVLILCNRSELIEQSAETLVKIGLTYEKVIPRTKRLHNSADVFLCMVETLYRRLLKNPRYLYNVGLIIADECHYMSFPKIYSFFNDVKILGVTATPILLGRDTFYRCARCESDYNELGTCCGMETYEWSKPKKLSDTYEDIVVGPTIDYLIEMGQLVKEINFVKTSADLSRLEIDSSGDFSNKSQDEAFGDDEAIFNCRLNYEQIAKGKRTVIFNNSTKTNVKVYEDFKNAGYPVRMYDSVNVTDETRQEIVNWFKETPGAILCNVATFLAGFDARNIECVILNVATLSIAKYLQAVGRGGRYCNEIYKPNFILIDGGDNVNRFGIWSDPTRDWKKMFFEGVGEIKPKKEQPLSVKECRSCGELYSANTNICPECGESKPIVIKERVESEEILQPIDNIPLPNGAKISTYVKSKEGDIFMAFAIMTQQIVDLFMYHGVSRERYEKWKGNGKLDKRIGEIVRPCYFVFLSEFRGDGKRTLKQVLKKVGEKLDKYYNI